MFKTFTFGDLLKAISVILFLGATYGYHETTIQNIRTDYNRLSKANEDLAFEMKALGKEVNLLTVEMARVQERLSSRSNTSAR